MGRPSSAGSVLRLVTRRISHPFPGLSPLGSRPRYRCLPRSPSEVLGPGLLATNLKPPLTSPFAGRLTNLQPIVQRRNTANRGLTNCNGKQPMHRMHWCSRKFTSCNVLGALQLNSHNPAHWNDRSHKKEGAIASRCSPDTTPLNAQLATLQSLARRVTGMHTERWNAGHNAAASTWSPSFIMGAVLSKVVSHQRLERPNGVSHLPRTPTRFATRICNETGYSDVTNAHRVMQHRC